MRGHPEIHIVPSIEETKDLGGSIVGSPHVKLTRPIAKKSRLGAEDIVQNIGSGIPDLDLVFVDTGSIIILIKEAESNCCGTGIVTGQSLNPSWCSGRSDSCDLAVLAPDSFFVLCSDLELPDFTPFTCRDVEICEVSYAFHCSCLNSSSIRSCVIFNFIILYKASQEICIRIFPGDHDSFVSGPIDSCGRVHDESCSGGAL
jgi:hypothetical protein